MLSDLFELLDKEGIIDGTIETIKDEVKIGNIKNAIELLKLVKPNELQEQRITGALDIQKEYILPSEIKQFEEHYKQSVGG